LKAPLVILILMLPVTACTSNGVISTDNIFDGVFLLGFETSEFEPCTNNEAWWLETTAEENTNFYNKVQIVRDDFARRYGAENIGTGIPLFYLSVEGTITQQKGEYGHLGQYDRKIIVSKAINVRQASNHEIQRCATSPLYQDSFLPTK